MNCEDRRQLEDLPDELLTLIYRYLNMIEILNSFSCLNRRLSRTINEFSQNIDLSSIPLKLIKRFVNEIFPHISSNVRTLIFNEYFPIKLEIFENLQRIHFLNSFSEDFLRNVKEIKLDLVPVDVKIDLIKKFFSSNEHSNLQSLVLNSFHGLNLSNIQYENVNQIKDLTITLKNNQDLFELFHLLSSSIEKLNIHIIFNGSFSSSRSLTSPMKFDKLRYFHLKTTFEDSIKFVELQSLVIESFASIEYLSVETLTRDEDYTNAFQWEQFLKELINFKDLHFSIRYRFPLNEHDDLQRQEEKLFQSFSTNFWLNQRKCFINFYSTVSIKNDNYMTNFFQRKNYGKLFFHTIPYGYKSIDANVDLSKAKSTVQPCQTRFEYSYQKKSFTRRSSFQSVNVGDSRSRKRHHLSNLSVSTLVHSS